MLRGEQASVTYHAVALPTGAFQSAAWVGQGQIALWGSGGLSLVDTRTWTARLIGPSLTEAAVSATGLIAWNKDQSSLAVYSPDGSLRFRKTLQSNSQPLALHTVQVNGRYAYLDTGDRYSLDLKTGSLTGPLASRARLLLPDYLYLP